MKHFEQVPHTADMTLRVTANSLKHLFEAALEGMFTISGPRYSNADRAPQPRKDSVEISAKDTESLLVDFLSHALALSDIYNQAYIQAQIHSIDPTHISANLLGSPIDGFTIEIKAVTFHGLHITQKEAVFQAEIVFDI